MTPCQSLHFVTRRQRVPEFILYRYVNELKRGLVHVKDIDSVETGIVIIEKPYDIEIFPNLEILLNLKHFWIVRVQKSPKKLDNIL